MEISLRQITYFVRLVEKRSFTAAAEALCITQPALSIAMSQLEKALGVKLIERATQPVTVTEFGETFHRYALRVQRDLVEARGELAALASGALGRLDLCMGPSAADAQVGAVLSAMTEDFPGLDISIQSGVLPGVADRVLTGAYSIYVGTTPEGFGAAGLTVTPLARLRFAVVAGGGHPLRRKGPIAACDLLDYPWIAIGNIDANVPDWRARFEALGLAPPKPAINVRNIALVRSLLSEGRFLTILPISMARADIAAGLLACLEPEGFDWRLPLAALTRTGAPLPAAARIFLERLQSAYAPRPDQPPL